MPRSNEERQAAFQALRPSRHPARAYGGWVEIRSEQVRGKEVVYELLATGPLGDGGRPPSPTIAASVVYGPRGGVNYLAYGTDSSLRDQEWQITALRDLIREHDPEGL